MCSLKIIMKIIIIITHIIVNLHNLRQGPVAMCFKVLESCAECMYGVQSQAMSMCCVLEQDTWHLLQLMKLNNVY